MADNHDSTGAMASAWFGTPGTSEAVEGVFGDKPAELTLATAPIGTKAPSCMGGAWYKTEHGWKWGGPFGVGGTYPRPGGDWTGKLVPPENIQLNSEEIQWLCSQVDVMKLLAGYHQHRLRMVNRHGADRDFKVNGESLPSEEVHVWLQKRILEVSNQIALNGLVHMQYKPNRKRGHRNYERH